MDQLNALYKRKMARLSTDTAPSGSDETLARGLQKLVLLAQLPYLTLLSSSTCSLASYLLEGDASGIEDLTVGFQALTSGRKSAASPLECCPQSCLGAYHGMVANSLLLTDAILFASIMKYSCRIFSPAAAPNPPAASPITTSLQQ